MSWRTSRPTLIILCLTSFLGLFLSDLQMQVLAQQSSLKIGSGEWGTRGPLWGLGAMGSGEGDFYSLVVRQSSMVSNQRIHSQSFTRQSPQQLAPGILQAQAPTPRSKPPRLPGRREPAAGRGCGVSMPKPPLTALIPNTTFGLTAATLPTFFFYIPETSAKEIRFVLLDEENENKLYDKTFAIPRASGIVSLSLSADKTLQPLKVGKNYRWYFLMICDPQEHSADIYVEGLVQPVELTPNLSSQLKKASPLDRVTLYQKNQLWYDALTTLAEQRGLKPEDAALQAEWENLLRSQGLSEISQTPLVGSLPNGNFISNPLKQRE